MNVDLIVAFSVPLSHSGSPYAYRLVRILRNVITLRATKSNSAAELAKDTMCGKRFSGGEEVCRPML